MEERWKDVEGYEGIYQVSDKGRVRSLDRYRDCTVRGGTLVKMKVPGKILKQWKRSSYYLVDFWRDGKRDVRSVHILVYKAFKSKLPAGKVLHHKDENKLNNFIENLVCVDWYTHNQIHHGGKPSWNKGLKMPPEVHIKAWETRRRRKCLQWK